MTWNRRGHCRGPISTTWRYRDFLETVVSGLFRDAPPAVRQNLWFKHDGAPASWGQDVRRWSDATYSRRCIGCRRTIAWLSQSPDLTPMDCFLRGYLKENIYAVPPRTFDDIVARFQAAETTVDAISLSVSRECGSAHCRLPWNGQRLIRTLVVTTRRPYFNDLILVVWSFDGDVTEHMFQSCFLTGNHSMGSWYTNFISPCIRIYVRLHACAYVCIYRGPKKCTDTVPPPFRPPTLLFDKMALAFMWPHQLLREYHTIRRAKLFGSTFKMSGYNLY
jgi:hypothetical protein